MLSEANQPNTEISSGSSSTDALPDVRSESASGAISNVQAGETAHLFGDSPRLPPVLDACCGSRTFWFDKADGRALFIDKRRETHELDIGTPGTIGRRPVVVDPDVLADFTELPFADGSFYLVVFDPPHMMSLGENSTFAKKYGRLFGDWECDIREGFSECFRVLKPNGTLVFKWCELEIPLSRVLSLTNERPLFGHTSGRRADTHWVCFIKGDGTMPSQSSQEAVAKKIGNTVSAVGEADSDAGTPA